MAEVFPSELVTTSVIALLDPASIGRIACASKPLCQIAECQVLWAELYQRRWQKENMLLQEECSPTSSDAKHRLLYKQRVCGMVSLVVAVGVHVLDGKLRDDIDGSETRVKAVLGFQKGRVGGYMCTDTDTLDSSLAQCTWVGMYAPAKTVGLDRSSQWTIHWEEKSRSSTRGCSYLGDFDLDGMRITGIYDDKDHAERSGTFELTASLSETVPTWGDLSRVILRMLGTDGSKQ